MAPIAPALATALASAARELRLAGELQRPRVCVVVPSLDAAKRLTWLLWDWHKDVESRWAPPILRDPGAYGAMALVLLEAAVPAALEQLPSEPTFDDVLVVGCDHAEELSALLQPLVKGRA